MLKDAHGSGACVSVNKQKNKSERAARRKIAVPPSESLTEPASSPLPATDISPPIPSPPSLPPANGEEEAALGRLADAGGPSVSPGQTPESPTPSSLEQRVRRLEEIVTRLQARRVAEPSVPVAAVPTPPPPTAIRLDATNRPLASAAPVATIVPDPAAVGVRSIASGSVLGLLWDAWAEARAIVRMFLDPRYRLPRSARVLPLVLLTAILTAEYWVPFSSLPILGGWLVKGIDLLLAFVLFKWLGQEARRYRQTSPDLPANLRL
jgi:hypothetical protein